MSGPFKKKRKMPPKPYEGLQRGQGLYYNTGELSFETRPQEAGTFPVIFLEWVVHPAWLEDQEKIEENDLDRENHYHPWYAKIVNHKNKIEVVNPAMISLVRI